MAQFQFPTNGNILAYSLVRFSTKRQADGDSFRRQVMAAEAFCRDENVTLDMSLHEADIRKLGMSGFTGEHVVKGPLRKFFAGIANGTVKPGSLLLVSEWSRLTRQVPMGEDDDNPGALDLVRRLMRAGIGIVDLQDRTLYTLDRYNADIAMQIGLQVKISMAYQYSQNLRHNLNSVWGGRMEALVGGNLKATNASPEWLRAANGIWLNAEERDGELWAIPDDETRLLFEAIERIKQDRFNGLGKHAIATRLNDKNQPGGAMPPFRGSNGWWPKSVQTLVENDALIGIYHPKNKAGEPKGEPKRFYPRVMTDDDFYRMQWTEKKAPAGKRTGSVLNNMFAGLVRCRCGAGLVRDNKGSCGSYLVCSKARRGLCDDRSRYHLDTLESEVLEALTRLDVETVTRMTDHLVERRDPQRERIDGLKAEIAAKQKIIDGFVDGFEGGTIPKAVFKRMATLESEIETVTTALVAAERLARVAEAHKVDDAHAAFRALVAAPSPQTPKAAASMGDLEGEPLYQLRCKIVVELGRLIERGVAHLGDMTIRFHSGLSGFHTEMVIATTGGRCMVTALRVVDIDGVTLTEYDRAGFAMLDPIEVHRLVKPIESLSAA